MFDGTRPFFLNGARVLATLLARPIRPPLPPHATVNIVRSCDQSCIMCRMPERSGPIQFMPLERFARLYSELAPQRLSLSNDGESLLHPDLGSVLRIARRSVVSLTTHLQFLPVGPEELVEGLSALKVSVDAATAETYHKIRGGDLGRTVNNIARVMEAARQNPRTRCRVRLHFVVQRDNQHEIGPFIRLAAGLRVDAVLFIRATVPNPPGIVDPKIAGLKTDVVLQAIRQGEAVASRYGVTTNLESFDHQPYSTSAAGEHWTRDTIGRWLGRLGLLGHVGCVYPWISADIQPSGAVLPCCVVGESQDPHMVVGSVAERSFREIWHGEEYRRLRRAMLTGNGLEAYSCHECPIPMDLPRLFRYLPVLVPRLWST